MRRVYRGVRVEGGGGVGLGGRTWSAVQLVGPVAAVRVAVAL